MNCDSVRDELLQYDWDDVDRQRLVEALNHLARCDDCRSAMADFDRLR
jgi:predicted anti-sigma-YlaC factor YlaD